MLYDSDTFEYRGHRFKLTIEHDDIGEAPWQREDGHGPVSDWTTRAKAPGELVLNADHGSRRYYDFAEAVKIAKRDGWDTEPYGTGTAGERAHRAAMADYKRLRDWCEDRWYYVGVIVTRLDENGIRTQGRESVWGVESDDDAGIAEVAHDLADEILGRYEDASHEFADDVTD